MSSVAKLLQADQYLCGKNILYKHLSRNKVIHISTRYYCASIVSEKKQVPKFSEKIKKIWHGPTFKYWFIGGTFFVSWMVYYGLKNYKKKCLDINILPLDPNHDIIFRKYETQKIDEILFLQESIFSRRNLKFISLLGVPGCGKTTLIKDYMEKVKDGKNSRIFALPVSNINVFLQCDTIDSFLLSLKAFASKLNIKLSDMEDNISDISDSFFDLNSLEKCEVILDCIQDALEKHPGWIIAIDNIQFNTPPELLKIIEKWFMQNECREKWSSGTVIFINEGLKDNISHLDDHKRYLLRKGMTPEDGLMLVKSIAKLDMEAATSEPIKLLINTVKMNPIGILCLGILLREKLSGKETKSIKKAVEEITESIKTNTINVIKDNEHMTSFVQSGAGNDLVILQTVIAMAAKIVTIDNRHLKHGIDLLSTLRPSLILPQTLVSRHLVNNFYQLPPLLSEKSPQFSTLESDTKTQVDNLEPESKLWSNKRLAEYLKKAEDFLMTGINTIKDIYSLVYAELPPLPIKNDGLDIFRDCELLLTGNIEPGGAKGISMHPLVYNTMRQHYLASTIYELEGNHLTKSKFHYDNLPWYRKFSSFSDQACLHTYRKTNFEHEGKIESKSNNAQVYIDRYNAGVNISSIYKKDFENKKDSLPGYYFPNEIERLGYLKSHIARVLSAICTDILVSKQDQMGKTSKENEFLHLKYLLDNYSIELVNEEIYSEAIRTLASCYNQLHRDPIKAKTLLEELINTDYKDKDMNLDLAKSLTMLGNINCSLDDPQSAKINLEEACEIYDRSRKKYGEYKRNIDFAKCLGTLGAVYGTLGLKQKSKETIERSLMFLQASPPDINDEAVSKQYGADFASSLTDLGHSYVSLGMPLYGKKILDLALAAHKNLHGENNVEVVRTLTVLGISHLMQGNNEESKRLRYEAGKIQKAINGIPCY